MDLFVGTSEYNNIFVGDVEPTNISDYICQWHITDEYIGPGRGVGSDRWAYI
jgi:hypothetical protein